MATLERLPSALVATHICTKLDLQDHTRLSTTSRYFGALCAQPAASPVAVVVVGDWPPPHALDSRPWLRPTRLDVDVSKSEAVSAFPAPPRRLPSHLIAAAQQLVWRSHRCVDVALVREAPRLVALSLPMLPAKDCLRIASACGARLVAFDCTDVYGPPREVADALRFEFPRLRALALLRISPLDGDALLRIARTCRELCALEVRVSELDDRVIALEFANLARLYLQLSGDRAAQQRGFVRVCGTRLPRLRQLKLIAALDSLRPLAAFATLEVLDVRRCCTQSGGRTPIDLPDPMPALTSLSLPLPNAPHLHVPRSYAATLTELETQYAAGAAIANLDRCDELPKLYPHLTHLLLYAAGTPLAIVQTVRDALQRVSDACVRLSKSMTTSAVRLCTLTLRDDTSSRAYDMRRVAEHVHNLSSIDRHLLQWHDVEATPALRCVDKQLLDERVLTLKRAVGEWRLSDLAPQNAREK